MKLPLIIVLTFGLAACGGGVASHSPPTVHVETVAAAIPSSCTRALDEADSAFGYVVQAFTQIQDIFTAIQTLDSATIETDASELESLTAKVGPVMSSYRADAAACRAEG